MKEFVVSIIFIVVAISLASYALYSNITGLFVAPSKKEEKIAEKNVTEVKEVENITEVTLRCPENCDDKNPCTEDFCSEETNYTCKHVNLTGEFEECKEVIEGTCSKFTCFKGKCILKEIPNCCGNKVCENGENCTSCPKDCGLCPIQNVTIEVINETKNRTQNVSFANHVVISEIYYDPINETCSEFVELYNPTGEVINISAWVIATPKSQKDAIIPQNSFIPAYGFYLIGDKCWSVGRDNPNWPEADHNETITLSNDDGWVILKDSLGNVIDIVGWENATYYEGNQTKDISQGNSLERSPKYLDTDNNLNDFIVRETPEPQNSSFKEIP